MQGPAPAVHLKEVSVKKELTVYWSLARSVSMKFFDLNPRYLSSKGRSEHWKGHNCSLYKLRLSNTIDIQVYIWICVLGVNTVYSYCCWLVQLYIDKFNWSFSDKKLYTEKPRMGELHGYWYPPKKYRILQSNATDRNITFSASIWTSHSPCQFQFLRQLHLQPQHLLELWKKIRWWKWCW